MKYLPNSMKVAADFSASKLKMAEWFVMNSKTNPFATIVFQTLSGWEVGEV